MAKCSGSIAIIEVSDGLTTFYQYAYNTSGTTAPTSGWSQSVPASAAGRFVWRREGTALSYDDVTSWGNEVCLTGATGATGAAGRGISSVTEYYLSTSASSGVTTGTSGWTTTVQGVTSSKKYLWNYTVTTYTDSTTSTSTPVLIGSYGDTGATGATGAKGDKGDVGQGVDSITEEYYLSTSKATQTGGSWVASPPTWSTGKYLWTRSKIVYKNPTDTKYTTPVCDNSWEAVNEVKDELNTVENHYGYKYFTDITVYGDSDKLYPVIIKGGNQGIKRDIFVRRAYSELAPPDWYTSTHKGDLVVKIKCNFGGWGGANYSWEIHELEEMYSRTFAGCQNVMSNMAFAIFLRGGGTTGARYHLYSNQSLNTPVYGGTSPQICYNNELLGETGQYSWNAPDPKTFKTLKPDKLQDSDQQAIDVRNFIPLSKKSVKTSDVEYYLSTSSTALSGGSWLTTAPQWVDGKFMWTRTKTTLNDGTVSYSPSSGGTCIAGARGATGPKGDTGAAAKSVYISAPDLFWHFTGRGVLTDAAQAITLTANAVNFTPASWQWYRDGTAISGATSSTYTVPSGETGTYSVTVDSTYPASVTVGIVTDGASEGMYLGILTTAGDAASWTAAYGGYKVPSGTFEGQNLIAGDYYVYNNGGTVTNYYFNGANFEIASGDNLSLFTNAFWDVLNLGTTQASGSFYTLFAQYFMAMEAVIVALGASQIHIQTLNGKNGCIYAGAYNADGELTDTDGVGFWLGESGQLKANYGEFLGSLRTGADAPTGARVGIKDRTGITSGPTFSGTGANDLKIIKDGSVAGEYQVKITQKDTSYDAGFDGVSWSIPVQNGASHSWRGIACNDSTWIMVDYYASVSRSVDGGNTWATPVAVDTNWYCISCNSTVWIIGGENCRISRSTDDGVTWGTPIAIGNNNIMRAIFGIACNGSTWVVCGYGGYWSRSTDNGASWSTLVRNGTTSWVGVACNGDTWVMVNTAGYYSRSTDNGASWSTPVQNGDIFWNSVACNGDMWVMVGNSGYWSRSTDNGVSWSTPAQNGANSWLGVACNGDAWVMVGSSGYWSRSTDNGASWSTPVQNGSDTWYGVACNSSSSNSIWVTVAFDGYWSRKQQVVTTDFFAWNKDSGDFSEDISMYPIRNITIGTDIVIRFPAYTGHVVGDTWSFTQEAIYGLKIADKDGNVYAKAGNGVFTITSLVIEGKGSLPVGAVYVQLAGQSSPEDIFTGTWEDVSSSYAGLFFRAAGGNAASFGSTQTDAIAGTSHGLYDAYNRTGWPNGSADTGNGTTIYMEYWRGTKSNAYISNIETRPVNSTVKIWKRTA